MTDLHAMSVSSRFSIAGLGRLHQHGALLRHCPGAKRDHSSCPAYLKLRKRKTPMQGSARGRFSYGGCADLLTDTSVWKFDVDILLEEGFPVERACYVKCTTRGEAMQALFARYPKTKIFGTGMPLDNAQSELETGRALHNGDIHLVDESALFRPDA